VTTGLSLWTVYDSPSDYPGRFVARRFELNRPTRLVLVASSLEGVRRLLPPGLYCLPRLPGDEPHIVEVWL